MRAATTAGAYGESWETEAVVPANEAVLIHTIVKRDWGLTEGAADAVVQAVWEPYATGDGSEGGRGDRGDLGVRDVRDVQSNQDDQDDQGVQGVQGVQSFQGFQGNQSDSSVFFDVLPKELVCPPAKLEVECVRHDATSGRLIIRTDVYARVVTIENELLLEDNYFDLMPGETKEVAYRTMTGVEWTGMPVVTCWNEAP
ncbi:glycoside hydrolase family 2 protein [Cohnella rhizosphaerae]|uniref:Beta-mannosidase Ig-fold domain-containing protein n=1 Tax=Cohnella rhizosphaerae TaxID=1457232 RepID=A0A9X4KT75_9BACL|nr:glycoside hydrolase family 2 protein [Cohnella rhizosphaerae]MDG0810649.1 hypothetical protein [Cohnella rhizosphaerae]